jgi:hypothetical protein
LNLLGTYFFFNVDVGARLKRFRKTLFQISPTPTLRLHSFTQINTEAGEEYGVSYPKLCEDIPVKDMKPMCEAQRRTLQSCPEFNNQWCYQDLGGTQALRAPCPGHLVCHYCLGLNPLHCVEIDVDFEESV